MSRHRRNDSREARGLDDDVIQSKRTRMEVDDDHGARGAPGGGGSASASTSYHRGGNSRDRERDRSPPSPRNYAGPDREYRDSYQSPGNFGQQDPYNRYGPPPNQYQYDTGYGGGYPQPMPPPPQTAPPTTSGWERAARAYQELAEARAKHTAEIVALRDKYDDALRNIADARLKENDLRTRIRDRDRTIQELEQELKEVQEARDTLSGEMVKLRQELQHLRREPRKRAAPFKPLSDSGWQSRERAPQTESSQAGPSGEAEVPAPQPPMGETPASATNAPAPAPARDDRDVVMTEAASATPAAPNPKGKGKAQDQPHVVKRRGQGASSRRSLGDSDSDDDESLGPTEKEQAAVLRLRYKPDTDLEQSGQPKSAWYRQWISKPSMAEDLASLLIDDDEDEDMALDVRLRDPLELYCSKMTRAAEAKEQSRVAAARKKVGVVIEPTPTSDLPEFGRWANTTIKSVVQAHNLRWFACVERDDEAIKFYKWLNTVYCRPYRYRPVGIRYLMDALSNDGRVLSGETLVHRTESTPRDTLGRYPAASADHLTVWRFFRRAPVNTWPVGMRLASGKMPVGDGFGVPHEDDVSAFFLLWHILPQRGASNPHRPHDARIRQLAVELFSIAGWYERIVTAGGYADAESSVPSRYPYSAGDASHVHVAAWFCTHGLKTDAATIRALERWGRFSRNHELGRASLDEKPWPSSPATIEEVSSPTHVAAIVKIDELAWGDALIDDTESNHADWDELIDVD